MPEPRDDPAASGTSQAAPDSPPASLLAGVMAVALDPIVVVDHQGRFLEFNPAAEQTFGYRRADVLGRDMTELIVPLRLRAGHRAGMARLAAGAPPRMLGRRIEITAQRADGSEFPVELAITRLGGEGPPVYAAHLRDISERQRTEADLERRIEDRTRALTREIEARRTAEDLFAKSFHGSPALMSIARLADGKLLEVNRAFVEIVGQPKEELIGRSTLELDLWNDTAEREIFLSTLRDHGHVRDFGAEFHNARGDRRTLLLNADVIEVAGDRCMLTVGVDITDSRMRAEAEAGRDRAEQRYRSIFENALEGLYQSTPDGRFVNVNPAFARMFGYTSPGPMIVAVNDIGRQLYVSPGRRAEFFALVQNHDSVTDFESEVLRADGTTFWLSESVRVHRDPRTHEIVLIEGVALDVTSQRETALALQSARDAADTASRAKSQFLANMSHELRTPLNGILGYTQILRRDASFAQRQRHGLDVIHGSAEHLLGLINDVLDLSRIEAGRFEVHPAPFALGELVQSVENLLMPRAREKGLALDLRVSPGLPAAVEGDEQRLRQILLNLLGNAIKFTAAGSVSLDVAHGEAPDQLRFEVRDTGSGIAPEDMDRLFQPFTQVGDARQHAGGSGLGLAISRSLVEVLGGQLKVTSSRSAGSCFSFELPLPQVAHTGKTRGPFTLRVQGHVGPPRRALVVDDVEANREVAALLLQDVGFVVAQAASGEEALGKVPEFGPDIVLLDLRMPGMGGLEAARVLRAGPGGDRLRLAMLSASAYEGDRAACLEAGCDAFLAKPIQEAELWPALEELLGITWLYEESTPPMPIGTDAPFAPVTTPPPPAEADAFHELAARGDVNGLRERAEALAAREPSLAPFAQAVLALADQYKMKAIRQYVSPWRAKTKSEG